MVAFATQAQGDSAFKKDAIEYIRVTGADNAFSKAIQVYGAKVDESKKEAYVKEVNGTLNWLYSKMADLYMKEFTQAEMKQLLAFYKTDVGKKLASKQTKIGQQGMILGVSWGQEVEEIAKKYSTK